MAKACAICGKPSGNYMFCFACNKLKDEGKVVKCEICGKWHLINEPCNCIEQNKAEEPKVDEAKQELTCLFCKEPSNGKHFCYKCYQKYKDRKIEVQICFLSDFKVTDEYGNKEILCDDGTKVRSRAEAIISNFFYNNGIRAVYEREFPYEEDGKDKTLHPDFYLPDYGEIVNGKHKGLIIEYNELTTADYLRGKKYAADIYKSHGYEVITLNTEDIQNNLKKIKIKLGIM